MIYCTKDFFHQRAFVYRYEGSKFYEPDFNDFETHLPYASGCGYVLSHQLVSYLADPPVPLRKFKNEDVGIGFLLASVQVKRVHDTRFHPEREGTGKQLCPTDFILQHRLKPPEFEACFNYIKTGHYDPE